ncbi:hypothetical protein [Streptomyces misionensis]|uniref:hypothetical protein n=1 Tax=Streptomyces misionensis TaxID=67331 RepID=UPI0036BBF490
MTTAPEPVKQPVGESEGSSRAAGGCVIAIAISGLLGACYAYPDFGTFVAGSVATVVVSKGRRWVARRHQDAPEGVEPEAEPADVVAVLQALSEGGNGVLLTALREATGLPDTKTVRAHLDAAGIRVRAGVRTPTGNGPGVHGSDIPPPSPTPLDPSPERCLCSSEAANANTNNRPDIVQDPRNPHRWRVVKEHA